MTKKLIIKEIAVNAIIAAFYFVLTLVSYPLAFGEINFRISEILILLCFWRRDFIIGITLGCFLSNTLSTLGPIDMLVGTIATLLSVLFVAFSPKLLIASLWPILFNAFAVGLELYLVLGSSFWLSVCYVGVGEGAVIIIAYIIMMILWRNKSFMNYLKPMRQMSPSW